MLSAALGNLLLNLVDDGVDHARVAAGCDDEIVAHIGELGEVDDGDVLGALERGGICGRAGDLEGGNAGGGKGRGGALNGSGLLVALGMGGGLCVQTSGVIEQLGVGHIRHGKPFWKIRQRERRAAYAL